MYFLCFRNFVNSAESPSVLPPAKPERAAFPKHHPQNVLPNLQIFTNLRFLKMASQYSLICIAFFFFNF